MASPGGRRVIHRHESVYRVLRPPRLCGLHLRNASEPIGDIVLSPLWPVAVCSGCRASIRRADLAKNLEFCGPRRQAGHRAGLLRNPDFGRLWLRRPGRTACRTLRRLPLGLVGIQVVCV